MCDPLPCQVAKLKQESGFFVLTPNRAKSLLWFPFHHH